jgi:non-specific serine/threonine protein kinase
MKSKEDALINIINKNRNGKYLVFSRIDNGFAYIKRSLDKANIDFAELKGTTSTMSSVLSKFKSGELNVILLSTKYAGSGIDISYATDIIIYHKMGEDKIQAVGRGQRVGRTSPLSVHNLLYEHEMSNS